MFLVRNLDANLLHGVAGTLPLQIAYRGRPVGDKLRLLRFDLFHAGTQDIKPESVYEPIRLTLSEGEWLDAQFLAGCPATVGIDGRILTVEKKLFRAGEICRIQTLVDGSPEKSFSRIRIDHRIADLGTIEREVFDEQKARPPLLSILYYGVLAVSSAFICMASAVGIYSSFKALSDPGLASEYIMSIMFGASVASTFLFAAAVPFLIFVVGPHAWRASKYFRAVKILEETPMP